MPRYKLTIEYDGRGFVGWQRQDNGLSVQEVIETGIHAFCGDTTRIVAAGRTDAGVHAVGQVAHADLSRAHAADTVRNALNFHVRPAAVAVVRAEPVGDDFHARFSAKRRHYLYRITDRPAPPVLHRGRVWWNPKRLDADAMAAAAAVLVGRHDFTTFRAALCQARSPVKTLDRLSVTRRGDEIHVEAAARSFLHHQVRNMVGTLRRVGMGKWSAADVEAALQARDRARGGETAPAAGLTFVSVDY
ncbi:MAG: tRNA pseudouridine(38-40) synthase TruA [Rhodospirillales bacterium]|nr:tRNA pseudouridine(38-40) synthase TruA [Rhodospirillales bacterium]